MSKTQYIKFECDNCGEKAIINDDTICPYSKGWEYLNKIKGNTSTNPTSRIQEEFVSYNEEDKHFCSKTCKITYISNLLGMGDKPGKLPAREEYREEPPMRDERPLRDPALKHKFSEDDDYEEPKPPKKFSDTKTEEDMVMFELSSEKKRRKRLFGR